jgi:HNH endonuclease
MPPIERFWGYVIRGDGCWSWSGPIQKPFGYGILNVQETGRRHPKRIRAHRFSYELHFGAIADGVWVLHHCDNPPCVRPEHLFLGTQIDNMRDMALKSRGRRKVCAAGHALIDGNLKVTRLNNGGIVRACLTCTRESHRLSAERKRRLNWRDDWRHHGRKLSDAQIIEIRHRGASTRTEQLNLASEFGVSDRAIRSIVNGEHWKRLVADN